MGACWYVTCRQCTELVNVAVLTGKMQTHAMRIYAVSHSGRLSDVTSQTTCHSGDEDALKVCLYTCSDYIFCLSSRWLKNCAVLLIGVFYAVICDQLISNSPSVAEHLSGA